MNEGFYLINVSADENYDDYLEHHGIKGQHWGVRRFQNEDGSLTAKGQKRYSDKADKIERKVNKVSRKAEKASGKFDKYMSRTIRKVDKNKATKLMQKRNKALKKQHKTLKKASKYFEKQFSKMKKYDVDDASISHFSEVGARIFQQKQVADLMARSEASMYAMYNLYSK